VSTPKNDIKASEGLGQLPNAPTTMSTSNTENANLEQEGWSVLIRKPMSSCHSVPTYSNDQCKYICSECDKSTAIFYKVTTLKASDELREKLRNLKRTTKFDFRYPIDAYEDDLVALIHSETTKAIERFVEGLELPKEDEHSHMTRNYCLDCAKRDGRNKALSEVKTTITQALALLKKTSKESF
jgi:hypothetical protein